MKNKCVSMVKPIRWFCFFLVLSGSMLSFAHTGSLTIVPLKPTPDIVRYQQKLAFNHLNKAKQITPFVNNPADITLNACGTSATLTSSTVPGYSNLIWDDGSTATTRTVTSSGTYWWQVTGTNAVSNGNFSSGNSNFTSSYIYMNNSSPCPGCCCGALSSEGTYSVNTDPHNLHTNFTSFGDHTSGTGKMLIVNGASIPNVKVWGENITVQANTDYVFSAWATSANPAAPAILQFSINGSPLGGTIKLSSTLSDGTWQYFTTTWNSGSLSGTVPIALVNQNTAANGNDFALDDIVFAPVYRQNIIVNLNPIPVLTLNGPNAACATYDLTKTIVGYDPSTYAYTFKDAANNTLTPANAQNITQSGTYTITEQNITTGCQSAAKQTTVTINPNPSKPGISAL